MYSITKEVYFCYGHRLMNHPGKCKHIHGHSVKASITIKQAELDYQDMVCDFSEIKTIAENYINETLDHNFIVQEDDPIIPMLKQQNERFMAIPDHPTAEILSKLIFDHLTSKGLNVNQVKLWETSSANACYSLT